MAGVLREALGQPFRLAARSPDELLGDALKAGMDLYFDHEARDAVTEQADTVDDVEASSAGIQRPWRQFAKLQGSEFSF